MYDLFHPLHLLHSTTASLLALAGFVFWIVMLVDAIRRDFGQGAVKLVWILVIFFLHFVGALIYFFAGRPMGKLKG